MRADGTHQKRLTLGLHHDPRFSPGGQRIVYVQREDDYAPGPYSPGTIFTVRTDTGEPRLIARGGISAVYAPQGGPRIAFARSGSVWTAHRDGTHQRRLTDPDPGFSDEVVDWSPDGRKIKFTRCEDYIHSCHPADLRTVRPDGTHERSAGNRLQL